MTDGADAAVAGSLTRLRAAGLAPAAGMTLATHSLPHGHVRVVLAAAGVVTSGAVAPAECLDPRRLDARVGELVAALMAVTGSPPPPIPGEGAGSRGEP